MKLRSDTGGMSVDAIRERTTRMGECTDCDRHLDIYALLAELATLKDHFTALEVNQSAQHMRDLVQKNGGLRDENERLQGELKRMKEDLDGARQTPKPRTEREEAHRHVGHDVTFGKGGPGGRCSTCHEDLELVQEYAIRAADAAESLATIHAQTKELSSSKREVSRLEDVIRLWYHYGSEDGLRTEAQRILKGGA